VGLSDHWSRVRFQAHVRHTETGAILLVDVLPDDPEYPMTTVRHFKGITYKMVGHGRHTETKELLVLYEPLDAPPEFVPHARPYKMFHEEVAWPDGIVRPRFTNFIFKVECEARRLYRVKARGFDPGIALFNGEDFVGVGHKYGATYVRTEHHWDVGHPFGTVKPLEALDVVLPGEIGTNDKLLDWLKAQEEKFAGSSGEG
jgi:hypothetical protein